MSEHFAENDAQALADACEDDYQRSLWALAESGVPGHLTPEVEVRLDRLADAENEAEIRWLIGEWLTEIACEVDRVIPPAKTGDDR